MNPLVKKEIRLLLPGFLAILALEAIAPWFLKDPGFVFSSTPVFFFFGMIILAIDSFGRELSPGTFTLLMSQPVERRQIWQTKIIVLLLAAVLIFAAYSIACELRLHQAIANINSAWQANPKIMGSVYRDSMIAGVTVNFHDSMIASIAGMLVALTGGLWTSLWLRQTAAAFWITLLTPIGLLFLIIFAFAKLNVTSDIVAFSILYGTAGIYSIAGFLLARRFFLRAQDAAWTGGIVDFSRWRYFESGAQSTFSARRHRPVTALLKKEFQLHSVSLICSGALLALHVAVIFMRKIHGHFESRSMLGTVSEFYWALWLVMPLIIGCTAMAEERRLGVMEEQFCLPASRRLQFALKFFPAILSGMLLGGLMPFLLEGLAVSIGAPNPDFNNQAGGFIQGFTVTARLALGLTLAGIFASTFAKSFLQALGIAIVTIIGCCLFTYIAGDTRVNFHSFRGVTWNPSLTIGIAVLTALVIFPLLTYRNFKYFQERGRMWRRNVCALTGAILFIFISSAALYNRAWEVFEPAEPAHGPAKLTLSDPPVMRTEGYNNNLLVQLPDGRVWFDYLNYRGSGDQEKPWQTWLWRAVNPLPRSAGPQRFLSGSNWVSATTGHVDERIGTTGTQKYTRIFGFLDSVGVQPDGTLWASGKSDQTTWASDKLTRFGDEANWQQVASSRGVASVLLLKKDGTLWRWGTNHFAPEDWPQKWPGLRAFQPYQIGTNSDWSELFSDNSSGEGTLARRSDGSVWAVSGRDRARNYGLFRETNYDQIVTQKFSTADYGQAGSYIRKDGSLWLFAYLYTNVPDVGSQRYFKTLQRSQDTNWVSSAVTWDWLVALKSDGTLWKWDSQYGYGLFFTHSAASPTRLGIHNDWVAITGVSSGVVALAADGSLWFWPDRSMYGYDYYSGQLLVNLPKQPQFLGNVFGKAD